MPARLKTRLLIVASACSLICACGGSSGGSSSAPEDPNDIALFGFIDIRNDQFESGVVATLNADFTRLPRSGISLADYNAANSEFNELLADGCGQPAPTDAAYRAAVELFDALDAMREDTLGSDVDAGDNLSISTSSGTFLAADRVSVDSGLQYRSSASGGLIVAASLNIPGAEFPAFSNVAVPAAPSVQISSETDINQISPSTVYTWSASGSDQSYIELEVETENFSFACTLPDNGSFEFPVGIQDQIGSGTIFRISLARVAKTSVFDNGALLEIVNSGAPTVIGAFPE